MHRKKGIMECVILTAVIILLSACGKNENGDKQGNSSENAQKVDYSYIPEYTELGGGEFTSFQDIQFAGDCLYYNQVFFDVVNQKNLPVLKQYSLTKNKILQEWDMIRNLEDGSRRQIIKYCVSEEGNMYTAESLYSGSSSETLLCSYDPDWNLRWEQNITAVLDEVKRYSQVNYIAADAEGRICLVAENIIFLFEPEGIYQGNVALEDAAINGLDVSRDGKFYVCYREQQGMGDLAWCLADVNFEKRELGTTYRNFPAYGTFTAGVEDHFLVSGTGCMYGYDLATQRAEELLDWAVCGMSGNYVEAVCEGENGDLMAFYQDFSAGKSFLVSLKRVETAALPEKTQVTVGCLGDSYELQSTVAMFNRQSDSCYVTLVNYAQEENGAGVDPQDFVNALSMALATGIDCPDILVLDQMEAYQMDIENIAGNDALADLWPFLESSSLLDGKDYLEIALECYQYQGRLVGIPCEIALRTVVGRASELGQKPSWTLEEMIAYAVAHPEGQLFSGAVREDILQDCLVFGLDTFINWETGQCCFGSEDFRELLAFVRTFPAEYDYLADDRTIPRQIQEGDVLLYKTMINDFYGIQEHQAMFGGAVVYIGYPAADGSGCIAECFGALALSAQSKNPEIAWKFIEYYLESSSDSKWRSGFSTRKSVLDKQMEEAVTVSYYLDEEGNPLLDADGKPVQKDLGGVRWSFAEDEITFRTATEEEVSCVKELIESARVVSTAEDRIMDMIREEAEPFFQGQKPVEEVMDIIQNRVQNYLDER